MSEMPHAIWSGSFNLFGIEVKCHTLSDGRRIIEAESMHQILEVLNGDEPIDSLASEDLAAFSRWRFAKDVTP